MRILWVDPTERRHPVLEREIDVDLAIVGGGLCGTGAAYSVAGLGASVALLEARTLGSGASGRNGGFVLAGPARSYEDAVDKSGAAAAARVWALTIENNETIDGLVQDLEIDCGYLRRGSMSVSSTWEEWGSLQRAHAEISAAGFRTCLVDRNQLPHPFDRLYTGGLYYPGNAEMNSGRFARAIGAAVADRVRIYEETPLTRLEYRGDRWRLETPQAAVNTPQVLLATNAWTQQMAPGTPIQPVRGQVVATEPLSRVVVPFPMYGDRGYQYWRQTADGRFVVGGFRNLTLQTELQHREETSPLIQDALTGFTEAIVPGAVIDHRWAGVMGYTPDMLPLVGPVPNRPGLWMAAGYSGHGVSMAFLLGGRAARRALGEATDIPEIFDPGRFAAAGSTRHARERTAPEAPDRRSPPDRR